jgi:hypothetical protein
LESQGTSIGGDNKMYHQVIEDAANIKELIYATIDATRHLRNGYDLK